MSGRGEHIRRVVIAEYQPIEGQPMIEGTWLAMYPDGAVRSYLTARALVRAIKRQDRRRADRLGAAVTTIEYRNVPAGFVPPDPKGVQ